MTRPSVASLVVAATVSAALCSAPPAAAQTANASDAAAAEALFDQGKAAMARQDYATACPKFFESNRLDTGIGTSLWLAECYEKNGQTASAWAEFREAASVSVKTADPRESIARARAAALEPKLSRLVIVVPPAARLPGLHIARDGKEVAAPLWGTPVPIDPGHHAIVVSAPDHRPRTISVDIARGPLLETREIPVLEEAPPGAVPVAAPDTAAPPASAPAETELQETGMPVGRMAALGAGGVGLVSIIVGSYFGLHAKSELADSNSGDCHANNLCNAAGVADRSSAQSSAAASTAFFIVGGVALAGGAALWFLTPARSRSHASIAPLVDPRARTGGVVLDADF